MDETIEQFIERGGTVKKIPTGKANRIKKKMPLYIVKSLKSKKQKRKKKRARKAKQLANDLWKESVEGYERAMANANS